MKKKLLSFMDEVIEQLQRENRMGSAGNYRRTRRSFELFLQRKGWKDVPFRKVDATLLAEYGEWLLLEECHRNTMAFHMRYLRATYNKALRTGMASIPSTGHPFMHVTTMPAPTSKRATDTDIIKQLCTLDIRASLIAAGKRQDKKLEKTLNDLAFARDIFLFCFYACGMPFVDFAYLSRENLRNGKLFYMRHKTSRYIEMEILPRMQQFIDQYAVEGPYLFPILKAVSPKEAYCQYLKALRKFNHKLDMLSRMLGPDVKLTSYVARHSWATTVYHHDMPVSYISQRMGHTTELTTRNYLKSFECSKIDEVNKRILHQVFM